MLVVENACCRERCSRFQVGYLFCLYPPDSRSNVICWIGCDSCPRWWHRVTEERREVCLVTLLAPWLTLDYDDSCIFSCGGWLCFIETVLLVPQHITLARLFSWYWSPKAFTRIRTELCKRQFGYTSRSSCLFCMEQINAYVASFYFFTFFYSFVQ